MTRGLARPLVRHTITVNSGFPGAADTAMLRLDDAAMAGLVARIALGNLVAPSELAGSVLFLASDHSGYVTGARINVGDGWPMH